jgi:hypothetical protein
LNPSLIQVTQSDAEEAMEAEEQPPRKKETSSSRKTSSKATARKEVAEVVMEEERRFVRQHRDVDHRQQNRPRKMSSPPRDLRSKIPSQVVKIKTEKGLEESGKARSEARLVFLPASIRSIPQGLHFALLFLFVCHTFRATGVSQYSGYN